MEQGAGLIMNPKRLSPGESVDFCGSCHGTYWDVELSGGTGVATARFPAYRLEKSRCWGCCYRTCTRCGRDSGSAFIELCVSCGGVLDG